MEVHRNSDECQTKFQIFQKFKSDFPRMQRFYLFRGNFERCVVVLDVAPNLLKGDRIVNLLESEHNNCSLDSKSERK